MTHDWTRRRILDLGLRSGSIAGLLSLRAEGQSIADTATPLNKAYRFLDRMMDKYAQGSTTRLVQSYVPTPALNLGDIGFTYDNALVIVALLQRGQGGDLTRATVLGDSLVYGQTHDPIADGRVRDSYHVNPYVLPDGSVNIGSGGSDTGNMAWAGLALARLYRQTNSASYLTAALGLGNWIQQFTYDTRGHGGYTGGLTQDQQPHLYKATEHNIDVYALFTSLATFTQDPAWSQRAHHALMFVHAMWNHAEGFFWTGTGDDGVTINTSFIPEDVQSWSYLATGDASRASSLDWAYAHLAATDGQFSGVSFSNVDTSGVWFEGTGHMAAGLRARNAAGDPAKASAFLSDIELGQAQAPHANGHGVDAASKDGLLTGDGGKYYAALHIGATSWYCIAQQTGNPFR